MGCETRIYDPTGLPLPDGAPDTPPESAVELRELAAWSEGMVWTSPERHGAMTGILKAQIDWIPLNALVPCSPTQGKTLAVMEVSGGSQSFNAVNQMRILGRWMRMITIPNQSSVAKAFLEFDEHDRMKPSSYYERVVDVMEELVKFTLVDPRRIGASSSTATANAANRRRNSPSGSISGRSDAKAIFHAASARTLAKTKAKRPVPKRFLESLGHWPSAAASRSRRRDRIKQSDDYGMPAGTGVRP